MNWVHSPQSYARALGQPRWTPAAWGYTRVVGVIDTASATITWTPGQPWEKVKALSPEDFMR